MPNRVLGFISRFTRNGTAKDTIDTFTCGCCYWFAYILTVRFSILNPEIVYDDIQNHFGTRIDHRVYDITGDVTDDYTWQPWASVSEDIADSVLRDCINF